MMIPNVDTKALCVICSVCVEKVVTVTSIKLGTRFSPL